MHLKPKDLVDLAEGTRSEVSAPHLATCDRCREQLSELRAMMASIADPEEVPEPSPLLWNHLQRRVADAVAAEGKPSRFGWVAWPARPRVLIPAAALAIVVGVAIGLGISARIPTPSLPEHPSEVAATTRSVGSELSGSSRLELLNDSLADDDPSLQLVADLADSLDATAASDAGLAAAGSAEHAVTHMTVAELAELQRLLGQELAKSPARII